MKTYSIALRKRGSSLWWVDYPANSMEEASDKVYDYLDWHMQHRGWKLYAGPLINKTD